MPSEKTPTRESREKLPIVHPEIETKKEPIMPFVITEMYNLKSQDHGSASGDFRVTGQFADKTLCSIILPKGNVVSFLDHMAKGDSQGEFVKSDDYGRNDMLNPYSYETHMPKVAFLSNKEGINTETNLLVIGHLAPLELQRQASLMYNAMKQATGLEIALKERYEFFRQKQKEAEELSDKENANFANPKVLKEYLQEHGVWNDQWNDALVAKLSKDVAEGERTFELIISGKEKKVVTRMNVVSGGLKYEKTESGEKGIIRAKKVITYLDSRGNEIPDRTKEFYEKDDRIVGGKIRKNDSAQNTFARELGEELPERITNEVFQQGWNRHMSNSFKCIKKTTNLTIEEQPNLVESISPGYPSLHTVSTIYPATMVISLDENFNLNDVYQKTEKVNLSNGETKITKITYEFVPESKT